MCRILFFILALSISTISFSQEGMFDDWDQSAVSASFHQGFVLKHDQYMGHLSKGITNGFEVSWLKKTPGTNAWQRLTHQPDVGFSLSFYDYASDMLGKTIALNYVTDYYLFRTKKVDSKFRLGVGLGYHTNPYDAETNNKNVAYGSHITFSLNSKLALRYHINDDWNVAVSGMLSHYSFGDFKRPNKGLNVMTASLGVGYNLSESPERILPTEEDRIASKKIRYNINLNGSLVTYKVIDKTMYPVYTLSFFANKPLSRLFDLTLGFDFFNNQLIKTIIKEDEDLTSGEFPDHKKLGVSIGSEYHMNRVSIFFVFGHYLYQPYKAVANFYQRYGLKFYLNDHLFLYAGFKTHRADAENTDFGVGYRF